eukprot:scaffold256970_cov41-Attheya_sp.AAC.1
MDVYGFNDPKRIESHIPSQIFLYPQRQHGSKELLFKHGNRRLDVDGFNDPKGIEVTHPQSNISLPSVKNPRSFHASRLMDTSCVTRDYFFEIKRQHGSGELHFKQGKRKLELDGRIANCLTEILTSGNTTRPRTLPRADKRTSQPGLIQEFYNKLREASGAPSRAPTKTSRADLRATSSHTTLTNRLAHN